MQTLTHSLRVNVQSCFLYTFCCIYLQLHHFSPFPSYPPSALFTHSHIMGGLSSLTMTPCPICPIMHTGCSVYCGEDVWSCRLKSLTSLVPTGGPYSIFTESVHVKVECVHYMRLQRESERSVAGKQGQNLALCLYVDLASRKYCLPFPFLAVFHFSHCHFSLLIFHN